MIKVPRPRTTESGRPSNSGTAPPTVDRPSRIRPPSTGLTEERVTRIIEQGGRARIASLMVVLLFGMFIPVYWFMEVGVPALGKEGRMAVAYREAFGDPSRVLPPVTEPGTAAVPRVVRLRLTDTLEIVDDAGTPVDALPFKAGETVRFQVENTAGFPHNFYIGMADTLRADAVGESPGVAPWSSGERTFDWVVPAAGTLQFACTVPGHYEPMHGDVVIQA